MTYSRDKRKKEVKDKEVRPGDSVLLKRDKITLRSRWDPHYYKVTKLAGLQVTARRGDEI